jgi:predicted acylesterase/phospholipase RssA
MSLTPRQKRRFAVTRPLDQMEVALVRAAGERPNWLTPAALDTVRYALGLARLEVVPTPEGDVAIGDALDEYRTRVIETLEPLVLETAGVIEYDEIVRVVPFLKGWTERARAALLRDAGGRFPVEALEREVREKALVVVAGGGGGSGYVYAGAYMLLEEMGLTPRLMVGTSIGSLLGLFRAKQQRLDLKPITELARQLSWRSVFLLPHVKNRYGVPAALRLYLRKTIAHLFQHPTEPRALRMNELEIPFRVVVAGLTGAGLTHDLEYYEHLMDDVVQSERVSWSALRGTVGKVIDTIGELVGRPTVMKEIVLGGDELTGQFDVVDAVGFSTAVPGLIHYDILRDDRHMHTLMERLFQRHGVVRLVDGGIVNNVPSRIAWQHVQRGDIGTRNAFILAMDCFAPQLTRNVLMHPVQRLVRPQVNANAVFAGFTKTFAQVLSPLDVVPDFKKIQVAMRNGYRELDHDRRFIAAMMRPVGPLSP